MDLFFSSRQLAISDVRPTCQISSRPPHFAAELLLSQRLATRVARTTLGCDNSAACQARGQKSSSPLLEPLLLRSLPTGSLNPRRRTNERSVVWATKRQAAPRKTTTPTSVLLLLALSLSLLFYPPNTPVMQILPSGQGKHASVTKFAHSERRWTCVVAVCSACCCCCCRCFKASGQFSWASFVCALARTGIEHEAGGSQVQTAVGRSVAR